MEVSVFIACQNSPWMSRYSSLKFVCMYLFRPLSEKSPPGCNFGKLHADRDNSAPRPFFSNRKEVLVPWIIDGGVDVKIKGERCILWSIAANRNQQSTRKAQTDYIINQWWNVYVESRVVANQKPVYLTLCKRWRDFPAIWLAEPNPKSRRVETNLEQSVSSQVA